MKSLIIVAPKAVNKKMFSKITKELEEQFVIVGCKFEKLDINNLAKKNEKKIITQKEMEEGLTVPCAMIIVEGENIINFGKSLKNKFGEDIIHVSENEEVARYEIERFFKKEEIFEHKKVNEKIFEN